MKHTHDDDRLTFGCPGCIDRVARDQRQALLDEQPDRPITIEWRAVAEQTGTIVLEVPYLADERPRDVALRHESEIHEHINGVVDFWGDFEWDIEDVSYGDAIGKAQSA